MQRPYHHVRRILLTSQEQDTSYVFYVNILCWFLSSSACPSVCRVLSASLVIIYLTWQTILSLRKLAGRQIMRNDRRASARIATMTLCTNVLPSAKMAIAADNNRLTLQRLIVGWGSIIIVIELYCIFVHFKMYCNVVTCNVGLMLSSSWNYHLPIESILFPWKLLSSIVNNSLPMESKLLPQKLPSPHSNWHPHINNPLSMFLTCL